MSPLPSVLRKDDMPNPFDDYINSLEGQTDVDPLAVVRDLRELHTQEISTREEKINQLTGVVAEKDDAIVKKDADISKWKAKNFDLVQQIPNPNEPHNSPSNKGDEKPIGSEISIGNLFKPEVRKRHGL